MPDSLVVNGEVVAFLCPAALEGILADDLQWKHVHQHTTILENC